MPHRRTKLSPSKITKLLDYFIAQVTARTAADLTRVSKDTAALFYHKIRVVIAKKLLEHTPFDGEVEIDESYFGGIRKGKRGRGAAGKTPVFGILKRGGRVYTAVVPDLKTATLLPIIKRSVIPDSIVYTDGFKSYNALDVSEFKHERIDHNKELVDEQGRHINGIENFWNQAKRVLRKYNGVPKVHFELFVKECEFRFNFGSPREQLRVLRAWLRDEGVI
jgi:transposase